MAFDPDVKNKVWSVWSSLHDFPRGKMTRYPGWKERAHGGVALSTDGGKTWQPSVEGMSDNSATTSIIIDPKSAPNNRTLYATVYNKGVFKSTDDGKTWTLKNKGIGENTCAFEYHAHVERNTIPRCQPDTGSQERQARKGVLCRCSL
ncbi:MAG: hypothetical protein WDO15_15340 [Bacteroidota bacterium]